MLETIIRNSLDIIQKTERLIDSAKRLLGTDSFDDWEIDRIHVEIERLTDVVFVMEDAVRMIRNAFEQRPEMARRYSVNAMLQ